MKTLFTLIFLGMALSGATQVPHSETGLAQRATTISRVMTNELHLNEQEYIQVKNLTLEKLRALQTITENYAYNPRLRDRKLSEIENAYQRQLRYTLSARQVEQYLAGHQETAPVLSSLPQE